MSIAYNCIIGKNSFETEYYAEFPDFDAGTSGETFEEALQSAQELLEILVKGRKQDNLPLPRHNILYDVTENDHIITIFYDD